MQGSKETSSLGYCIEIGPKFTRLKQNQQQVTQHRFLFLLPFCLFKLRKYYKKTMLLLFTEKCISKLTQLQRNKQNKNSTNRHKT